MTFLKIFNLNQTRSLNELWYETEEKIKKVATTTISNARKQENKEWFDEEWATVNEEKNCASVGVIQIQNRTRAAKLTAMNDYGQARRRKKHLFRKKRQLDDQSLIEIDRPANFISA
jgi:hypothetical protein